ncbi:MAG: hypothetical protein GC153_10965 [Alphaproteobacteria bacterium]|nr:hypothetical protein [Alphaproteobacteria bacterium]
MTLARSPIIALCASAALFAFAAAAPAASENAAAAQQATPITTDEAIAFAKQMTADATAALTAPGETEAQHLAAFQTVLDKSLALDVIGKFMLGANRSSMTEDQLARYNAVFPKYMTKQYAEQFKDIVGKPLEVLDSKQIGPKDVIVRTQFKREAGAPINVDWRVRKLNSGDLKMIDIIVSGVSIMLVKREEFSSFIASNGVDALIERLEQQAA